MSTNLREDCPLAARSLVPAPRSGAPLPPGTDAEVATAKSQLRPEATLVVGIVGLALLVWLMEGKPF